MTDQDARYAARDARTCEGCDSPLNPIEALHWRVCMPCTQARHKAVLARRCICGAKRRPGTPVSQAGRAWTPCRRCLGAITRT